MKKNSPWIILYILFLVGMISAIFILDSQKRAMQAENDLMRSYQMKIDKRMEVCLIKWIYDNSERISRATCEEIAQKVMETKYPLLILAIIEVESMKFTPGALSPKIGAIGWCQVRYEVHSASLIKAGIIKEKRDLWDIGSNIKAGAFIFEMYLRQNKGDISKTLESYLGGKDGAYLLRVLINHANLSVLVSQQEFSVVDNALRVSSLPVK